MRKLLTMFSLLLLCTTLVLAQQRQITGKITDKNGQPVSGATVQVKGTNSGTSAGADGSFTVNAKSGDVLEISAVNFGSISVRVGSGSSVGSVALETKENVMDEVVVTAGGLIRKKREEGYNATRVTAQQITQAKATNVAASLTGKVAGLQVNAINGGVNPTVRLVLRGNRSLLGNNNALLVVDNVIVPNDILGNLNPEDIEDINVLNGAGAAALYGSDASNGAIIVTTKKGKPGVNSVKISNTTTIEQVSFSPGLQTEFGSGWQTGAFTEYENQQYGPRFDGSIKQLGRTSLTGEKQEYPYSANNDREKFWENGIQNQSDFQITSSDEKSTYFISGQYLTVEGTTPLDRYNRSQVRFNGSRNVVKGLKLSYTANYIQNRYDITTETASIYNNLLNTPAWAPLKKFNHWESDFFSSPEGYYNDYYANPYFTLANYRQANRNDYLSGNAELNWAPASWVDVIARVGLTTRNQSNKNTAGRYIFSNSAYITGSKASVAGGVSDAMFYSTQINTDLLVTFKKRVEDFKFNLTLGHSLRNNTTKVVNVGSNGGIVVPELFNISNRISEFPSATEGNSTARQFGVFGKFQVGFKNWLFVDVTGRNDWRSVLDPDHRAFFYPSADVSFIASEAIEALKNSKFINTLKIRGGWSQVGNVNIDPYSLLPTFSPGGGFPFSASGPGYTVDNRIVALGIKPEITTGFEGGFDIDMLDQRISAGITYYSTRTSDQTVPTGVSAASGFSSYLQNTGEVSNQGIEALLHYTAIRGKDWTVTVGGNYTFNKNKVISISNDVPRLGLSTGGSAQVYAIPELYFPVLVGTDYIRDDQGRVVVDAITGYPTGTTDGNILGNTNPKHRLGLDVEIKYKSFRLWALGEYRGGYYFYNDMGSTMDFSGSSIRTVAYDRDRFVFPNSSYEDPTRPGTYIANTSVQVRDGGSGFWANGDGNYNMNVGSNYVIKGDFWKIRELSLSYDLPRAFLARTKYIKGATISVQGRNLFLWTPKSNIYTDPEYNFSDGNAIGVTTLSQSPPSRYFGGTLSLTF